MYQRLTRLASPLIAAPRALRRAIAVVLDAAGIAVAFLAALALRFEGIPLAPLDVAGILLTAWVSAGAVFFAARLYQSLIRAMGPTGYLVIGVGMTISGLAVALIEAVPWDVAVSFAALGTVILAALRVAIRGLIFLGASRSARPVIIYGAGESGRRMAGALSGGSAYRPVAFVDDEAALHRAVMSGLPVRCPRELPELIERHGAAMVILAMPSVPRARRREILKTLAPLRVAIRTLPDLSDLVSGQVSADDLQQVDIADLLGRDAVDARPDLLAACIRGKAVMVTGAGGSIGSELCRQIIAQAPKRLVLFEISEISLYHIEQGLRAQIASLGAEIELIALLGDVNDSDRLEAAMRCYQVATVYHAAAYKHVPIVEANVAPGLLNNIFGTHSAALAAARAGVEVFVLISTDKAVNPTNVMGATKRAAELVLQALQPRYPGTVFSMVRFGNVLGSSGSVVPLFEEQIRRGGPVTVTHPDIVRYFMTIPEAAQLVIQAGAMARGGELFVLDMGAPVRIADLARRMIELAGFVVLEPGAQGEGIAIEYTGLRPGEKLYEELLIGNNVSGTEHAMIMRATEHAWEWAELEPQLERMRRLAAEFNAAGLIECLQTCVREYTPEREIHDLLEQAGRRARLAPVTQLRR
jgi:FlaA1/EpsC-like NDP-sugar epimerase